MQFKVWNKKDDINGISAEVIIDAHKIRENDEIILFSKGSVVTQIENSSTLKANFNLDESLTAEDVAKAYLSIKEEEEIKNEQLRLVEEAKLEEGTDVSVLVAQMFTTLMPQTFSTGEPNKHLVHLYTSLLNRGAVKEEEIPVNILEFIKNV